MTLATTDSQGAACAAPVYFAAKEFAVSAGITGWRLYFFSEATSQHAQNLAHDNRAAGAIYPECQGWQDIRGLQLRGAAEPVAKGSEWELAWQVYRDKFPFVAQLKPIVVRNELYAFAPTWIRMVDNRRGFGFKQEWVFP